MQWVAFLIIANAWLKLYIEQKSQECSSLTNDKMSKYNQLHMFLTGPGGTGKIYVIGGLIKLMVSYTVTVGNASDTLLLQVELLNS